MRRRVLLAGFVLAAVGAAVVAVAQPPAPPVVPPTPPRALPGIPTAPPATVPPAAAAANDVLLSQFDPLDAFPPQTQSAVRGVLLGANWMTRMNQAQGRFLFGYNPALRQPLLGDHDLKQARAALALAQAAKFTGDEKQGAIAAQAILALLAATKIDPADPSCRVPVHSSLTCNRVGFAATLALAVYELPAADARLVAEAGRLCEFLRRQCRPDGSVHYTDGPTDDPEKIDSAGVNEYPGAALYAIAAGNALRPAAWKTEAVKKGVEFYRAKFRANPHPLLAATLTPACTELYLQTKLNDAAATYGILTDSCGAGQYRGGCGIVREYDILAEEAMLAVRIDSVKNPPWGMAGGMAGGTGRVVVNPGTNHERQLQPLSDGNMLKRGDVLRIETGGGGGYGHPFDRPAESVLDDVLGGFVTAGAAQELYGVVIDENTVDDTLTRKLRTKRPEVRAFHRHAYVDSLA